MPVHEQRKILSNQCLFRDVMMTTFLSSSYKFVCVRIHNQHQQFYLINLFVYKIGAQKKNQNINFLFM